MRVSILSDIHGNLTAMEAVTEDLRKTTINGCIFLGDLVDYGPHSNEVIHMVSAIKEPIYCNLWGNHEHAIMNHDFSRFSSERGRESARFTQKSLSNQSKHFLNAEMQPGGFYEFILDGKKCLAVHGSLEDYFWKSIFPNQDLSKYEPYDYVFSGHSHEPHYFEQYYAVQNPVTRNRKKTVFINPGSVGQPRNLNPMAQYAILDTGSEKMEFRKVNYDWEKEIAAFSDAVDPFYQERLKRGV